MASPIASTTLNRLVLRRVRFRILDDHSHHIHERCEWMIFVFANFVGQVGRMPAGSASMLIRADMLGLVWRKSQ